MGFKLSVSVSQLPELRPAGGSPDSRSIKDQRSFRVAAIVMEANLPAEGVGEFKIREVLANSGARVCPLRHASPYRVTDRCRGIETKVIAFHGLVHYHRELHRIKRINVDSSSALQRKRTPFNVLQLAT